MEPLNVPSFLTSEQSGSRIHSRKVRVKRTFISHIREGGKVEDVFLVTSKTIANTRNGSRYLKIRLADRTGEIEAVKWEATESEINRMQEDEYVLVHGSAKSYNDNLQLTVDSFKKWNDPVDPSDFIRSSPHDPEKMMAEFLAIIGQVTDTHIKTLLDGLFGDEKFLMKFKQAPAAKTNHHAYVSGLLEHTLNVLRIVVALADLYPQAHRDLLIAGAALHDIGKIDEFEWAGSIKYSEYGHLVGHIVGGTMIVREAIEGIQGFDPVLGNTLLHMILAHHGKLEFGSPKLPQCIEAMLLNHADDMDAQVAIFEAAIVSSDENGEAGLFTKRHFLLGRHIYKGLSRREQGGNGAEDCESDLDLLAVDEEYDPFADE